MIKKLVGFLGISIFIFSIFFYHSLKKSEELASEVDTAETVYGMIGDDAPLPCAWDVKTPERVISEEKSQALLVTVTNSMDEACESTLSLRAPGFDMSPQKEEQKVSLPASGSGSLSWILTPRKSGTYEIAVSDILNTKIFGITVKTMFGLSAIQAKIASVLGSLFGPMLTVPWWWERWRMKKKSAEV